MKMVILRHCPALPYMAQVSASRPRPYSSYLIHERPETFAEADVEIRYEVSYLEHAGASAAVICGRGNSNSSWVKVSSRLKTAARLGARLSRALSVRMFYKLTATGGLLSISSLVVSSLTPKQTSHPFRAFLICIVQQSHPSPVTISAHEMSVIGNMHYVS